MPSFLAVAGKEKLISVCYVNMTIAEVDLTFSRGGLTAAER